jgi:deoxyribodipyrimidine photo-lyase
VRRWVPELARVPADRLHTPWELHESEQRRLGVILGKDYPYPIVDHAWARRRGLAA